jgi:hypothetical protein
MAPTSDVDRLREGLLTLEERAGITKAMERAREGRFIPMGALGDKCTPAEYFADEHDAVRDKTRDAYFSVPDLALRKELISADREIDEAQAEAFAADRIAASRALMLAEAKARREPWLNAGIAAVASVGVGAWFFNLPGAIAGAVGGYFFGHAIVSNAKNDAAVEVERARESLAAAKEGEEEVRGRPAFFSGSEEDSGERDKEFDRRSALSELWQRERAPE